MAADDAQRLLAGTHSRPHSVLGPHAATLDGLSGVVVRAMSHGATAAWVVLQDGALHAMHVAAHGILECFIPEARERVPYTLRMQFADGATVDAHDPYRFLRRLARSTCTSSVKAAPAALGEARRASARSVDGVAGTSFAVWAPNARGVIGHRLVQ